MKTCKSSFIYHSIDISYLFDRPKHILRETISGYKAAYYIVIKAFDQSDVGTYNCISTNSIGNSEGTLRVYGK